MSYSVPRVLWSGAEFVPVCGDALLWDLVGSGPSVWVTSTCNRDISTNA